jgi:predicted nucleic acid-binding protein
VRSYFDSSALVAAMVEEEAHHARAFDALVENKDGFTSAHALAEVFATLTSGRLDIQLAPEEAEELVEANVAGRLRVVELTLSDYRAAMRASREVGARGGAIYDMLHLQAARRGKAERILTINVRHFQVFAPDLAKLITMP